MPKTTDVPPVTLLRDRYELRTPLATGGMGTVWAAHDHRLDRPVAVKLLRHDIPGSTADRMEREARAAARVDDPRVVAVLDLDHLDDGRPFIVLELHDGWTLADELDLGPLPPERFDRLTDDLLGALAAAHVCGVLHRDIKPSNVLADDRGFKLTDFGLASIETVTTDDDDTEVMGTVAYVAPERLRGATGSTASDVFSAAVVLHRAISGAKPYAADDPAQALASVLAGAIAPLPDHVPASVRAALSAALAADPEERPPDAVALLGAMRAGASPVGATPTVRVGGDRARPLPAFAASNEGGGDGDRTQPIGRPGWSDEPTATGDCTMPVATVASPAPLPDDGSPTRLDELLDRLEGLGR